MSQDKKVLYTVAVVLTAFLLAISLIPGGYGRIAAAILLIPATLAVCLLVKKRSILSMHKKQILLLMAVIGLLYTVLLYVSGLHFGFRLTEYPLSVSSAFRYLLPGAVIIIAIEIIRSVLLAQQDRISSILAYAMGVLAEILVVQSTLQVKTFNGFMDLMGMTLLPAVIANLLYQWVCRRYGPYPNMVYRALTTLYPFVLPVIPAVTDALLAFVKLTLPLLIYVFLSALYERKRRHALGKKGRWSAVGITAAALVMISIVMLISNQFRFGILVIGSESMTGELNKGDAIIFERYEEQPIPIGQVIVFEQEGTVVIHRVVDVKRINGVNQYYTKGDVNEDVDVGFVTESQILGLAGIKIPYVGYPTVWMRALFANH